MKSSSKNTTKPNAERVPDPGARFCKPDGTRQFRTAYVNVPKKNGIGSLMLSITAIRRNIPMNTVVPRVGFTKRTSPPWCCLRFNVKSCSPTKREKCSKLIMSG
ncbi:MAG: hypothetical protein FWG36_07090 [Oscillospiraceae bacterium]|nr:hypothetical protein [Oscillospiraceae bacterium]